LFHPRIKFGFSQTIRRLIKFINHLRSIT